MPARFPAREASDVSDHPAELDTLIAEAAVLHAVLEEARAQQAVAAARINEAIGPYVVLKNRIGQLVDEMIREAVRKDAHT